MPLIMFAVPKIKNLLNQELNKISIKEINSCKITIKKTPPLQLIFFNKNLFKSMTQIIKKILIIHISMIFQFEKNTLINSITLNTIKKKNTMKKKNINWKMIMILSNRIRRKIMRKINSFCRMN
jgi:hypothetical protein